MSANLKPTAAPTVPMSFAVPMAEDAFAGLNEAQREAVWHGTEQDADSRALLIIAGAGSMARLGDTRGLYLAEMVASAILLAGFLMAGTLEKGAKTAITNRRANAPAVSDVSDGDAGDGSG